MPDQRPIAISIVILTIAVVIFAATFISGSGNWSGNSNSASQGSGTKGSGTKGSHAKDVTSDMERGAIDDQGKLPQDIELLAASTNGEVNGKVLCGNCTFQTGEDCNVMIHDELNKRLVSVLPNEHYDGLNALIGST